VPPPVVSIGSKESHMRLSIVTRYFPPDAAPTGKAVAEVTVALAWLLPNVSISVVTTDGHYAQTPPLEEAEIPVVRLRALPRMATSILRLVFSLIEGRRLVRRALAGADIVVTISDPPLCELWMAHRREGQYWIHWPMDLYPEVFVAGGLAQPGSLPLRLLARHLRCYSPDLLMAISAFQATLLQRRQENERGQDRGALVLPCGVRDRPSTPPPTLDRAGRVVLVCAGNAGQGFAAAFLLQLAQRLDPARHLLLVSLRGSQAAGLKQAILASAPAAVWHDWLSEEVMAGAAVHVVAQLPAWAGVSVPSRAVTALTLGRPVIAAGAQESDLAHWGRQAGCFVPLSQEGTATEDALAAALSLLEAGAMADATGGAVALGDDLRRQRLEGIEELARWIALRQGAPLEGPVPDAGRQFHATPDRLDIGKQAVCPAQPDEVIG
jgi:hypothetical protein